MTGRASFTMNLELIILVFASIAFCNTAPTKKEESDGSQKDVSTTGRIGEINNKAGIHISGVDTIEDWNDLPEEIFKQINRKPHHRSKRLAMYHRLWPKSEDGLVYVPYTLRFGEKDVRVDVEHAAALFAEKTCIRFVPWESERFTIYDHRVEIIDGLHTGCWAWPGYRRSLYPVQEVSLGWGCNSEAIVIHELMHVLSFRHTMKQPNRDNYVRVFPENIMPDLRHNFDKVNDNDNAVVSGLPFNMNSVMMYRRYDFSVNGYPTIESLNDPEEETRLDTWTEQDIEEINRLYDCTGYYDRSATANRQ